MTDKEARETQEAFMEEVAWYLSGTLKRVGYHGLKAGVTGASCEIDSRLSHQPEQGCESRIRGVVLGEMVRNPWRGKDGTELERGTGIQVT